MSSQQAFKNESALRIVRSTEEIIKLFTEILMQKIPLNLTQKGENGIIDGLGSVKSVETINRFVVEVALRDPHSIVFDVFRPIKIYSIHRRITFETNFKINRIGNLVFSIPSTVEILENRKEPRFPFKKGEDNLAKLLIEHGPEKQLELVRPMYDISKSGMAIQIDDSQASFFVPGQIYQITAGPNGLRQKHIQILYVKQVRDLYSNKLHFRVGCRFQEAQA